MSRAEWLRTFVAVCRSGSVTAGAELRGLSQPAASQHLSALSRAVGEPLVRRRSRGVELTARGLELYAAVADPLDKLESVLAGLDGGRLTRKHSPLRIGSTAEVFEAVVLPRLLDFERSVTATFADDAVTHRLLEQGHLDVAVTRTTPPQQGRFDAVVIGQRRFALIAAPDAQPVRPLRTIPDLAAWLPGRPWVAYSHELYITRSFWVSVLGRPFEADVRLVAHDLRTVTRAVELGVGISLLPTHACADSIADGRVQEVYDVSDLIAAEPWFACSRRAGSAEPQVVECVQRLLHAPGELARRPRARERA